MTQKKRKKHGRVERMAMTPLEVADPVPPAQHPRTLFIWGLAAGFCATLAVTVACDVGWIPLGEWSQAPAGAGPALTDSAPAYRIFVLEGSLPEGGVLLADGALTRHAAQDSFTLVTVPLEARSLEVRGDTGTWWTTPLTEGTPDTLRPLWSGEIVVEGRPGLGEAILRVDGKDAGVVPGSCDGLTPGWHVISVQSGETVLYEDARRVGPGDLVTMSVPAAPPRGTARLIVRSRRLDAQGAAETKARPVRLDGKIAGETPLEINVEAGYHSVAVADPNQPMHVSVLRVEAGSARYVDMETTEEPPARLEIGPTTKLGPEGPWVVSVRVLRAEAPIQSAHLEIERPGQRETVVIPLVAAPNESGLWVGAVPASLTKRGPVRGFVSATDALGNPGWSEITLIKP